MTIKRQDVSPRNISVGDILFVEFEYEPVRKRVRLAGKFICWEYYGEYIKAEFLQIETCDLILSMFGLKDSDLFMEMTRFNINKDSIITLQLVSQNELILYKLLTEGDRGE